MSDTWFAILLPIVLLFFAGLVVVLLIWPSKFLRYFQNPLQPDTPLNRVHARTLGIFFCLFLLMIISGSTKTLEGFHRNIVVALWVSTILMPIFLWILWRYSSLQHVNRRYLAGEPEEGQWEGRMSVTFCSLLSIIVVTAFILATRGIYPK